MHFETIHPPPSLSLFLRSIQVFEEPQTDLKTVLPFFADGYPGLLFHETANGLTVYPHNKRMPELFLYGQTLKPIELEMHGSYRMIVLQLYPFVLKSFFGVHPIELNDDCYDLSSLFPDIRRKLLETTDRSERIGLLQELLLTSFHEKKDALDQSVRQAIRLIEQHKGQLTIQQLARELHLTPRTLERRFTEETGISPKQFSQIIRFSLSLEQLAARDYGKLSDIVFANGFADQSHFIRVFKAFTGTTPKKFGTAF